MQIKGYVKLYKTPLDSGYKNVYDDYEDVEEYKDFLDANFSSITIPSTGILPSKSCKDENGVFNIVINGYTSMDLHDYNYMAFGINDGELSWKDKFAFITSILSENDGVNNPSCRLTCKLDVWSNHYLDFNQLHIMGNVRRMIPPSYQVAKTFIGNNIEKRLECKKSYYKSLNRTFEMNNERYTIIWERYHLSNKCTNDIGTKIISCCYEGNGIYCYRIAGFMNCKTRKLADITLTWYDENNNPIQMGGNSKELNLFENVGTSDYVLSRELTVWTPFSYDVLGGRLFLPTNMQYKQYGYQSGGSFHQEFFGFSRIFDTPYIGMTERNVTLAIGVNPTSLLTPEDIDMVTNTPSLSKFPFYFYNVLGKGINKNLVFPERSTTYIIRILEEGRLEPELFFNYEKENIYEYERPVRLPSMFLEYSEMANYLRNNQNQIAVTEHYNNISNIITQVKSAGNMFLALQGIGIPKAPTDMLSPMQESINSLKNVYSFQAMLEDKKAVRGNLIDGDIASAYSYLDDITVLLCDAYDYNYLKTIYIARDIAYNGIEFNGTVEVMYNFKNVYDYIECFIQNFNACIAEEDKNEIVNAFRRGIRKWHISTGSDDTVRMELNVSNPYR